MKTLFLIPVYNCAKKLSSFFSFLYKLDPQPDLYVFAENNSDDETLNRVWKFKRPHEVIRLWFRKDASIICESPYDTIAQVRQTLLTFARNFDPDYAIFLDSDVYPKTKELIDCLSFWGKDIVGGAYLRAFPEGVWLASKWQVPGDPKHYALHKKVTRALDETLMTSAGCLCLSRKIIQDKRVNFYPVRPEGASEDFGYCLQARYYGYKTYLDGTINLEHIIGKKIPKKPWTFDSIQNSYVPFYYNSA